VVAGADISAIVEGYQNAVNSLPTSRPNLYGDGRASEKIVQILCSFNKTEQSKSIRIIS
jgi:UDP-N-acetylglucosamine 2-epimerase